VTELAVVLDELMNELKHLPAVHTASQLRVMADRLITALGEAAPPIDAARALERAAIDALEQDAWFRVYRTAHRIVTALTPTTDRHGTPSTTANLTVASPGRRPMQRGEEMMGDARHTPGPSANEDGQDGDCTNERLNAENR